MANRVEQRYLWDRSGSIAGRLIPPLLDLHCYSMTWYSSYGICSSQIRKFPFAFSTSRRWLVNCLKNRRIFGSRSWTMRWFSFKGTIRWQFQEVLLENYDPERTRSMTELGARHCIQHESQSQFTLLFSLFCLIDRQASSGEMTKRWIHCGMFTDSALEFLPPLRSGKFSPFLLSFREDRKAIFARLARSSHSSGISVLALLKLPALVAR